MESLQMTAFEGLQSIIHSLVTSQLKKSPIGPTIISRKAEKENIN